MRQGHLAAVVCVLMSASLHSGSCCSDMRWVFVRGGEQPTVVTRGPVLRNANPNQPTGVHLMRTRSPS